MFLYRNCGSKSALPIVVWLEISFWYFIATNPPPTFYLCIILKQHANPWWNCNSLVQCEGSPGRTDRGQWLFKIILEIFGKTEMLTLELEIDVFLRQARQVWVFFRELEIPDNPVAGCSSHWAQLCKVFLVPILSPTPVLLTVSGQHGRNLHFVSASDDENEFWRWWFFEKHSKLKYWFSRKCFPKICSALQILFSSRYFSIHFC